MGTSGSWKGEIVSSEKNQRLLHDFNINGTKKIRKKNEAAFGRPSMPASLPYIWAPERRGTNAEWTEAQKCV